MRRILLVLAACLLGFSLSAQPGREISPHLQPDSNSPTGLRSPALRLPLNTLPQDSFNINYTYWFDEDYANRQQGNLGNGHMLIDASTLDDGFHALYMQLGHGTSARLENFMFYTYHPLPGLGTDSFNINYTYWFDEDFAHRQEGNLGNGHLMIDASTLDDGFHALYMQLGYGTAARLENFMFYTYHPLPGMGTDSFNINYTYWFDEDYAHRQEGNLGNGHLMIDASALDDGFHTVYMQLGHGTAARLENFIFFISPERFYEEYTDLVYWFGDDTTVHRLTPLAGTHLLEVPEMDCGAQGIVHLMAVDSTGRSSAVLDHTFIMMDSTCCLPPLFVTVDSVSDTGAYMHWDYNRPMSYTLAYDTVPFDNPDSCNNIVTLTDTVFHFEGMHAGITCHYAIKANCDSSADAWVRGEWSTVCRTVTPVYVEACDSYDWRGNSYSQSGTYRDTVPTALGYAVQCDSIYELNLTMHYSISTEQQVTACRSYEWHGRTLTESTDTATHHTHTAAGCDSTVTLHLTVNHPTHADLTERDTACGRYRWHERTYRASGAYTYTHVYDDSPCPGIDTLHLTIRPVYDQRLTVSIMEGDSISFNGRTYRHGGVYVDTLQSVDGCDSLQTLVLHITPLRMQIARATVCQGESYSNSHFTVTATATATTGTLSLRDTLRTSRGFDSLVYGLDLTVLPNHLSSVGGRLPAADSVIANGDVVLRWDAVEGATGYRVYLWTAGQPMPTSPTYVTSNTHQNIPLYQNRQTYSWKVEAYNPCDTTAGAVQRFMIYKEPSMTLGSHALAFGEVELNGSARQTLSIGGRDLTDSIRLSLRGTDSTMFALSSDRLDRYGGSVAVSFVPTAVQRVFNAYLVVTGGTVRDTVSLTGLLAGYYQFEVNVSDSVPAPNSPVAITGTLRNAAAVAQAGVPVDVYVTVMGRTLVVTDTTDANGQFGTTYMPVNSECGYYQVGACLHGSHSRRTMAEFNIPGISILSTNIDWYVQQSDTLQGTITLKNRSNITLHNITVTADSLPAGASIQFAPLTLQPLGTADLHYTLVGSTATIGNEYENARFTATCTEGNLGTLAAYYYCHRPVPDLSIAFDTIVCAIVPGTQKVVDVVLRNNTDSTFRNVTLQTPPGFAALRPLNVDSTYTMAPHSTLFVPLLAMMPEDTPLAPLSGSVLVTADNVPPQMVPFVVNVVSNATGSLRVLVSNEYTYAYGTHVSDAHVTVVGYYSLDTVATATTGSSGMLIFDSLPEGYYHLYVSAPDNDSYAGVIQIRGSRQTFQEVHLEYQAVSYSWDVRQVSMDDEYTIQLNTTFKTNVPKPVVTLDVPRFTVPYDGSFGSFNIVASNHGLIDCYDATITVPTSDYYDFVPLYDRIDTLHALSSVTIPCAVRNKAIHNAVLTANSNQHCIAETTYRTRSWTEMRTRYRDTIIYVPVSRVVNDTTHDTVMVLDTMYIQVPHTVIDTVIDSIVDRIYWYDTLIRDTVLSLSAGLEALWGNCETHPFRLMAQWKCSAGGKWVYAGTTTEKMDCTHPKDDTEHIIRHITVDTIRSGIGIPQVGWANDFWWSDSIRHVKKPQINWPGINWPDLPKIDVDWECQPCWFTATIGALDCAGNIALTIGSAGLSSLAQGAARTAASTARNDAANYRGLMGNYNRAMASGNPTAIAQAGSGMGAGAAQTPIRGMNQAARYARMSQQLDRFSNTADGLGILIPFVNGQYGDAAIAGTIALLGKVNPALGTIGTCMKDLYDVISGCQGVKAEIPWAYNLAFDVDTNVNEYNIRLAKRYQDTLHSIRRRIVNDSLPVYDEHPEVLTSIVSNLLSYDSATVEQILDCYDTTITVIDTNVLLHYVERWNRTVNYYRQGWLTPEYVPEGQSLDFFYLDTNTTGALLDMELTAMDEGYWSIEEMFLGTLDSMVAAPKKKSVCAGVSLRFTQEVAMTREAFEGVLTVNNPHDSNALRDLSLLFTVSDTLGHDCTDKFDIQVIDRHNVDTNGSIAPGTAGTITVRFVPLMSAAPTAPVPYLFGGAIDYTDPFTSAEMSDELKPVLLTVQPCPHLLFDYFVPHTIIADDPLTTPVIEPAVAATIGLRILNDGMGAANGVRISSLSPQIVENSQGLVVDFAMTGTLKDGQATSQPLSDIALGDMASDETHTMEYMLKSSLLGTIRVNDVNVIHNSSVDDRDMSLVTARAHRLVKPILEYRAGADSIHDFLTHGNSSNRPDSIYFSSGRATTVASADTALFDHYVVTTDTTVMPDGSIQVAQTVDTLVRLTLMPDTTGWQYARTDDPGRGKYEIVSCIRDDSVNIPLENIWLSFVDIEAGLDPNYVNHMHIVDTLGAIRPTTYFVTFRLKEDVLKVSRIMDIPLRAIGTTLDSVRVRFTMPVIDSTFTFADMSLKCNNGAELMDSTVGVRRIDDSTYNVDISRKTYAFGLYVLKVMADSIMNSDGHYGAGGLEAHWVHANCMTVKDSIAHTACDNYTWRGERLTATGIYTDTLSQMAGCDSILLLNLTIHESDSVVLADTACDSYLWQDSVYTASATATVLTTNRYGCDSTVTLNLTIYESDSIVLADTACDSYFWQDSVYTASATASVLATNRYGCDSTVTLNLVINYSTHDTIVDTAAGSYSWQGHTYTESGEYRFEGQTSEGCDSVIVLQLTVTEVGINSVDSTADITLFPNPTKGKVTILSEGVVKVEVYDQAGRRVAEVVGGNEVDLGHLPSGLYTLHITLQHSATVRRIVKQ